LLAKSHFAAARAALSSVKTTTYDRNSLKIYLDLGFHYGTMGA
jgi:hypothetical protein